MPNSLKKIKDTVVEWEVPRELICVCEIRKQEERGGASRKRGTERLTGLLL